MLYCLGVVRGGLFGLNAKIAFIEVKSAARGSQTRGSHGRKHFEEVEDGFRDDFKGAEVSVQKAAVVLITAVGSHTDFDGSSLNQAKSIAHKHPKIAAALAERRRDVVADIELHIQPQDAWKSVIEDLDICLIKLMRTCQVNKEGQVLDQLNQFTTLDPSERTCEPSIGQRHLAPAVQGKEAFKVSLFCHQIFLITSTTMNRFKTTNGQSVLVKSYEVLCRNLSKHQQSKAGRSCLVPGVNLVYPRTSATAVRAIPALSNPGTHQLKLMNETDVDSTLEASMPYIRWKGL